MRSARRSPRLPDVTLPDDITITQEMADIAGAETVLLAVPAQSLRDVLTAHTAHLHGKLLVACCKGIDLETLTGPVMTVARTSRVLCPLS